MALIDRLLQRMRIVTKILLFLVPLIVLIAGIGLFGYFTAGTLNGQMTLTRQTIETLSSFQQLRSALTAFTDLPSAATRDWLIASISDQEKGAATLDAMLADPAQKQQISAVRELGAKMQGGADTLWAVSQERANTEQAIDDEVARLFKESQSAASNSTCFRIRRTEKRPSSGHFFSMPRPIRASESALRNCARQPHEQPPLRIWPRPSAACCHRSSKKRARV